LFYITTSGCSVAASNFFTFVRGKRRNVLVKTCSEKWNWAIFGQECWLGYSLTIFFLLIFHDAFQESSTKLFDLSLSCLEQKSKRPLIANAVTMLSPPNINFRFEELDKATEQYFAHFILFQ